MKFSELLHGDVLLYEHRKKANFITKAIRLVTGSQYVHCGIVLEIDRKKYILEQMTERMHSYTPLYYNFDGEVIHCVRPTFAIPEINEYKVCQRYNYGYHGIVDCLINHFLGRISFGLWEYKPLLTRLIKTERTICSTLVARILDLQNNTKWCKYPEVVEPDDFGNHVEDFVYVGTVEWS